MQKAIAQIKLEVSKIVYESRDDEGAAEWHGHLESVLEGLQGGTLTVAQASDSLGITLEE